MAGAAWRQSRYGAGEPCDGGSREKTSECDESGKVILVAGDKGLEKGGKRDMRRAHSHAVCFSHVFLGVEERC